MNELQLVVTENVVGKLSTNIDELAKFVKERIKDYDPSKYEGDAASAKKSRAELNNAKKVISQSRIQLFAEIMKPYQETENKIKDVEKLIDTASKALDEIVKAKEAEEKEAKRKVIQTMFNTKNFNLVPLDKIFVNQWLNKSYKITDIDKELDSIIQKIYNDLKVIESYTEDSETLKAMYLDTLDLSGTIAKEEEIQKNRELVAKEKSERAEREHNAVIKQQEAEVYQEFKDNNKQKAMSSLVADALEEEVTEEEPVNYLLSFSATKDQVIQIKNFLNMNGIIFDRCEEVEF